MTENNPDESLLNGVSAVLGQTVTTSANDSKTEIRTDNANTKFRVSFGCANMPLIIKETTEEHAAHLIVLYALKEGYQHITFDQLA